MSAYSDLILADEPALYLRLGESSGTVANDETANNRDGTYIDTPTLGVAGALAGDANTAVDFNGSSEWVTFAYSPFVNGTVRTFEGWSWRDNTTNVDELFGSDAASNHVSLRMHSGADTAVRFYSSTAGASGNWSASAWPGLAQWVYWVLIFDEPGNLAELFINAVSQGTQAVTTAYNAAPGNLRLGLGSPSFPTQSWDGKQDEFAVYERALTPERISVHYEVGANGPPVALSPRTRVREPSWIGATIEAPGEDVRCSPLEASAFATPTNLEFSTETPGLFGHASFTLPRPDYFVADDVRRWLLAPVRYFDEDNRTVYEGRITGNSQVGANEIQLDCEGFAKSLEDREDARAIIIDRDLGNWGEPSTQRKLINIGAGRHTEAAPSVGSQDAGAGAPGITMEFTEFVAGSIENGESWYYGGGVALGALRYDFDTTSTTNSDFLDQAALSTDDLLTASNGGTDHNQTDTLNQSVTASGATKPYAVLRSRYEGVATGTIPVFHNWVNLGVLGTHGLTERGTWPDIGFYLHDIVRYIIEQWGTLLTLSDRSLETTGFALPDAKWLEDTKPADMIEGLALFGGNSLLPMDWGVGPGREFFMASPGNYGRVWRARLDKAAESADAGDDAHEAINGVKVTYQTPAGTRTVGPPGSQSRIETTALLDTRPDNPVNFAKGADTRTRSVSMGITSDEGAVLVGQTVLADANNKRWSGDIDFKGHIREYGGGSQPAYMIWAGDRGVVEDDPDTAQRRITATTYDQEARKVKATIGQPPGRFETVLARADVVLQGLL